MGFCRAADGAGLSGSRPQRVIRVANGLRFFARRAGRSASGRGEEYRVAAPVAGLVRRPDGQSGRVAAGADGGTGGEAATVSVAHTHHRPAVRGRSVVQRHHLAVQALAAEPVFGWVFRGVVRLGVDRDHGLRIRLPLVPRPAVRCGLRARGRRRRTQGVPGGVRCCIAGLPEGCRRARRSAASDRLRVRPVDRCAYSPRGASRPAGPVGSPARWRERGDLQPGRVIQPEARLPVDLSTGR